MPDCMLKAVRLFELRGRQPSSPQRKAASETLSLEAGGSLCRGAKPAPPTGQSSHQPRAPAKGTPTDHGFLRSPSMRPYKKFKRPTPRCIYIFCLLDDAYVVGEPKEAYEALLLLQKLIWEDCSLDTNASKVDFYCPAANDFDASQGKNHPLHFVDARFRGSPKHQCGLRLSTIRTPSNAPVHC